MLAMLEGAAGGTPTEPLVIPLAKAAEGSAR